MISVIFRATPKNLKGSPLRPQFQNIANPTSRIPSLTSRLLLRATVPSSTDRAYSSSDISHTRRTMASAPSTAPSSTTNSTIPTPASSTHSISPPASIKSSNPSIVLATPSLLAASTHRPLIDTAAIDAQMKLASLNHLAGYSTKSYPDAVPQQSATTYTPEEMARGYEVLREPFFNKGMYLQPITQYIPSTILINNRNLLRPRRSHHQEPHRLDPSRHGIHVHTSRPRHEDDKYPQHSHRQVPVPLDPQSQQRRPLLPRAHRQRGAAHAIGLHAYHWRCLSSVFYAVH